MNIAGDVFIVLGLVFMVITALGLLRLPDFFSRVHAVSKSETLGIALLLLGLILHEGATLLSLKFALILVFVAIANPVGAPSAYPRRLAHGTDALAEGGTRMIWWLELSLFGLLVVAALIALSVRDMIAAVATLSVYSFLAAALLALMGAVDVALTEAALGAGVTGVFLIGAISVVERRTPD